VVGGATIVTSDNYDSRAFLWQNGRMIDASACPRGSPTGLAHEDQMP
jgi:probable HAF family extracellular repeat protein